jgi:hypothetical protein
MLRLGITQRVDNKLGTLKASTYDGMINSYPSKLTLSVSIQSSSGSRRVGFDELYGCAVYTHAGSSMPAYRVARLPYVYKFAAPVMPPSPGITPHPPHTPKIIANEFSLVRLRIPNSHNP